MEERRRIDRVDYQAKSVIVVCDTGESIFVETRNAVSYTHLTLPTT